MASSSVFPIGKCLGLGEWLRRVGFYECWCGSICKVREQWRNYISSRLVNQSSVEHVCDSELILLPTTPSKETCQNNQAKLCHIFQPKSWNPQIQNEVLYLTFQRWGSVIKVHKTILSCEIWCVQQCLPYYKPVDLPVPSKSRERICLESKYYILNETPALVKRVFVDRVLED